MATVIYYADIYAKSKLSYKNNLSKKILNF